MCWPQDINQTFCLTLGAQGSVPTEAFYPPHPGMGTTCIHTGRPKQSLVNSCASHTLGGGVRGKRIQSSASQTINICGNHCGFVNLQILIYWVRAGTQDFVHLTSCHRVARIRFLCFILLFPNNIFSNYVNNNMLHI